MKPLVIELFAGLHGFGEAASDVGYRVVGFDLFNMPKELGFPPPRGDIQLVIQDVMTLHGSQFKDAAFIWGSPPCQKYSYMAMPWDLSKREIRWWEWERSSPFGNFTLNDLFGACFRIQREASEAAGRYIPMVVENVVGAQRWVGRAKWHFGSFYLFGDVPALMPFSGKLKNSGGSWFGERDGKKLARNDPRDMRLNESGEYVNAAAQGGWNHPGKVLDGTKAGGFSWSDYGKPGYKAQAFNGTAEKRLKDGVKQGGSWWHDPDSMTRRFSSRSSARRAASAQIAKIPYELAEHIARVYLP